VILLTGSLAYSAGVAFIEAGNTRRLIQCCAVAWLLGLAFMILKFGVEWRDDFSKHLFPGPGFATNGTLGGGARIFFVFYFLGTAIHGLHLMVGLILVGWIILFARREEFSPLYYTPVSVVGIYWSFVDVVWIVLYPLIYLVGRGT
jgi:cytochrome c oxidase subunit III